MRVLLFLIIGIFLFAKEIIITKYLENRPTIYLDYKGENRGLKILKMDLKVLDHFNYYFKDSQKGYKFKFFLRGKKLKVEYFNNDHIFKIKVYRTNSLDMYPFLIHKAVYDINRFFKLYPAEFLIRKVVYSALTSPKETTIYIADYSLNYKKPLVVGGINIFPKWVDKNQKEIFYTRLEKQATIYRLNILTGKQKKIISSNGMAVVSDIKDGKILLTLSVNDQPDIYEYNSNTNKLIRITKYKGIDVSGKFWGDNIVFISDRYQIPLLFEKKISDNSIHRVLYQGKNQVGVDTFKNRLVVSVRETSKAFGKNSFNLFLLDKNSDSFKRLTTHGQNSFPNFSIDGTSIMFIKTENFISKFGIVRLKENKIFYYPLNKKLQSFDW